MTYRTHQRSICWFYWSVDLWCSMNLFSAKSEEVPNIFWCRVRRCVLSFSVWCNSKLNLSGLWTVGRTKHDIWRHHLGLRGAVMACFDYFLTFLADSKKFQLQPYLQQLTHNIVEMTCELLYLLHVYTFTSLNHDRIEKNAEYLYLIVYLHWTVSSKDKK